MPDEPLRTPEQMEWIRDRFKPDGLRRLARSTPDYYEQKGYYLPDVAALAYAEWERAEALVAELEQLRAELRSQWESNHWEHCRAEWPHEGVCHWPLPDVLAVEAAQ
jgi:hypothetical protein